MKCELQIILFCGFFVIIKAFPQAAQEPKAPQASPTENVTERAKYDFAYEVKDKKSGVDFGQKESRDGDNTVGSYIVQLADSRILKVKYKVNGESGFITEVVYEGEAKFPEQPKPEDGKPKQSSLHSSDVVDSLPASDHSFQDFSNHDQEQSEDPHRQLQLQQQQQEFDVFLEQPQRDSPEHFQSDDAPPGQFQSGFQDLNQPVDSLPNHEFQSNFNQQAGVRKRASVGSSEKVPDSDWPNFKTFSKVTTRKGSLEEHLGRPCFEQPVPEGGTRSDP